MINKIKQDTSSIKDKVIGYRRDFHQYAESGWTEFRTSSLIARRLADLGYKVMVGTDIISKEDRMGLPDEAVLAKHWQRAMEQGGDPEFLLKMKGGFTGVVGILQNGNGPVKALRFDIDALDIEEADNTDHLPVREGFASINTGAMHACGHDFHGATGLGVAEILIKNRDLIKGTVKLIFQPAEEGVRGAKSMVAAGILDDVTVLFGHHVNPSWEVGEISSGLSDYIATKKFDVTFHGKPAHAGASPQAGANAMVAAATAILNLYAISRHKGGETRINIGKMTAGSGRNIICDKAHLVMETRGATTEISDYMYDKAQKIIQHAALMHDCTSEIVFMGEAQSGKSDPELMDFVEKTAIEIGNYKLIDIHKSGGSEDFTYMMGKVQSNGGKAVNIGVGAGRLGGGAHAHDFDVKEETLEYAVLLMTILALK